MLLVAAVLGVPTQGAAQVVVRGDVDGEAARDFRDAGRRCGATGLAIEGGTRPAPPAPDPAVLEAVRVARAATLAAEFDRAIADLGRLYRTLESQPELAGTGRIWAEALTVDAYARWSRAGSPDAIPADVSARLDEAVSFWSDVPIDRDVMPPAIERALEGARQRRAGLPQGEVVIDDPRMRPWAWVSGSPETSRRVRRPAGRLLVVTSDDAGAVRARIAAVSPGRPARVSLGSSTLAASRLRALGRDVGAFAVWADSAGGVHAVGWSAGRAVEERADSADALVERLGVCTHEAPAGARAVHRDGPARARPHEAGSGVPLWVWGLVAGVAVAAGGTALTVSLLQQPEAHIRAHVEQ